MVWTTRGNISKTISKRSREIQKPKEGHKLTWIKLVERDPEEVKGKVAVINLKGLTNNWEQMAKNRHMVSYVRRL